MSEEKKDKPKEEPIKVRRPNIWEFMRLKDRLARRAKWASYHDFNRRIIGGE